MLDLEKVVNKLISLSEEKYIFLEDILLLTEKQTAVIELSDIDGLNLLIDRKQEKLDNIKFLDTEFEAIVSDLKTLYEINNLDELEVKCGKIINLKDCISRIMDKLREISSLEQLNKEKMIKAKDELQEKIVNAANGKRAINQYGNFSAHTNPYFIDRKIR